MERVNGSTINRRAIAERLARGFRVFFSPSEDLRAWGLALRLVSLIYAVSFASLLPQLYGLISEQGILPVAKTLQSVRQADGPAAYFLHWNLFWLTSADAALYVVAVIGILLGLLGALRQPGRFVLFFLWLIHLSFVKSGQIFTVYVWDVFLCELGLLLFLAGPAPLQLHRLLLRFLVFRLMFSMGTVKFLIGSDDWTNLSIMQHFYANQPSPSFLAYWLAKLPLWLHQMSAFFVFLAEIPLPLLFFVRGWPRLVAFFSVAVLQAFIMLSGNFGIFNLLTIVAALGCLTDAELAKLVGRRLIQFIPTPKTSQSSITTPSGRVLLAISVLYFLFVVYPAAFYVRGAIVKDSEYLHETNWIFQRRDQALQLDWLTRSVLEFAARNYLVNPYALFGDIPRYRLEILTDVSADGVNFVPLEFHIKPATGRAPVHYAPHLRRLEHQLYYESHRIRFPELTTRKSYFLGYPWLKAFAENLLSGKRGALSLTQNGQTLGFVPKFLRFRYEFYRFSTIAEKAQCQCYWVAEPARQGRFFEQTVTLADTARIP